MAVNVEKMREALVLLHQAEATLNEAIGDTTCWSGSSMTEAVEDLEIDVTRAENGDLE